MVFRNPAFLESLPHCKGIIVLSNYLKNWIEEQLYKLKHNILNIPVLSIKHPTEFPEEKFTLSKLEKNEDKKVIQVGAWMRDTYAIYRLPQPKFFKKYALQGKGMENYYPHDDYSPKIKKYLLRIGCRRDDKENTDCMSISSCSHKSEDCNKYISGLLKSIQKNDDSVTIIEYQTNEKYDKLLSDNIVFVNYVDCSASNTLIECIVRNTPILVNRHPAVEEYLGKKYPFYYKTLEDAQAKLNNPWLIVKTYHYLMDMYKEDLRIQYFIDKLLSSYLFQNLSS